jgi:hypothetical protein
VAFEQRVQVNDPRLRASLEWLYGLGGGQIEGQPQLAEQGKQLAQLGAGMTGFDGDQPRPADTCAGGEILLTQLQVMSTCAYEQAELTWRVGSHWTIPRM